MWHTPMARSPIYRGMVHHVDWWICLHLINLVGFPFVGLAGYLLTQGIYHPAAIVSRVAVAVFIPIYAAFDALIGIGTGTLVCLVSRLAPDESTTFEPILTAYWTSGTITAVAVTGSIAWTIAMLSAAVALTSPARLRPAALLSVIIFFVTGWARTNLMSPDGSTISQAWWFVLVAIGLATLIVAKATLACSATGIVRGFVWCRPYHANWTSRSSLFIWRGALCRVWAEGPNEYPEVQNVMPARSPTTNDRAQDYFERN